MEGREALVKRAAGRLREAEEVFLVDRVEHCDGRTLDDLVFQRGNPQRALLVGARLGYELCRTGCARYVP
jgi:hypothetical protein